VVDDAAEQAGLFKLINRHAAYIKPGDRKRAKSKTARVKRAKRLAAIQRRWSRYED
jgi:ribosomal protein S21